MTINAPIVSSLNRATHGGWHFLLSVIGTVCVLMVLGVGADPMRIERHIATATATDVEWSPGVEAAIPGTSVRYRRARPPEGSLVSLAEHELRAELERLHLAEAEDARPARQTLCVTSSFTEVLDLGERHGRFAPRWQKEMVAATGRDNRERVVAPLARGGAAVIPADAPDGCTAPPAFLRLADFIAPPRLPMLMGYLDAGYFAPT